MSTDKQQLKQYFEVYNSQVSGKQPKLLTKDKHKILKGFNQFQYQFYQHLKHMNYSHFHHQISKYIPKYHGIKELQTEPILNVHQQNQINTITWLTHLSNRYKKKNTQNKFIMLQNITYGWQMSNVFDIKIGGRNVQGKRHKITKSVLNFNIKLNGCKIHHLKGQSQTIFLSKYYLSKVIDQTGFINYFGLFFFDGQSLNLVTVSLIEEKLIDLILRFKSVKGFKFISSSLLLAYDALDPTKADLKLLDFGRIQEKDPDFVDEESITGLQNILRLIISLRESNDRLKQKIFQLKDHYSKTLIMVIPQNKIQQFEQY